MRGGPPGRLRRFPWMQQIRAASTANGRVDHYEVLGLKPSATSKEIKAAYYALSKKHHPDINPDRQEEAAKMFHQVAESYEVLSSDEKRRAFDATRHSSTATRRPPPRSPAYTDLDLEYKHFEYFQRKAAKRRQQQQANWEWPEDFADATERVAAHKDSRTMQREMEELRREIEREQTRMQARYPLPTFEEMLRQKRRREAEEQRKYTVGFLASLAVASFLFLVVRG